MKLLPGDHVAQKDLTDEQYHAIAKKFMDAGAKEGEYGNNYERSTYYYFGWSCDGGLYHGNYPYPEASFLNGRLLTPSQILDDDNGWFERGELPPVNTECEAHHNGRSWQKCKIIAIVEAADGEDECIYQMEHDWDFIRAPEGFRPIKSDRDKAVEAACKAIEMKCGSPKSIYKKYATAIYDAGLLKLPEGEK